MLAARHHTPQRLTRLSRQGVPIAAILVSTVIGSLCGVAAYISLDTVFLVLLNSSGAVILFICLSQLILRRRTPDDELPVTMWG
ncbi:hypothetical protein GCM10009539_37050 [Cryptosporangium japonicum]|uniref:Amino acid permease/ SLC12A domain-containing protein n=1 Tax=Cryptosporangium japonicum TaxID=80872 RepID=A0ABP3E3H5_9ACTN